MGKLLISLSYLVILAGLVSALYEDQVFKFDWRQQLIGKVEKLTVFPTSLDPVFLVSTDRHVLAALDSDSGRIIWRHKFEEDSIEGEVRAIGSTGKHVVSVSGGTADLFLRIWEPIKGYLVQEHYLRLKAKPDHVSTYKHHVYAATYHHQTKSIEVTKQGFDTKKLSAEPSTVQLNAEVLMADSSSAWKCQTDANLLVCADRAEGVFYADMSSSNGQLVKVALPQGAANLDADSLRLGHNIVEVDVDTGAAGGRSVVRYPLESSGPGVKLSSQGELMTAPQQDKQPAWWRHVSTGCEGVSGVVQSCKESGRDTNGYVYCAEYENKIRILGKEEITVTLSHNRGIMEKVWCECGENPEEFQLVLLMEDAALISVTPRGNIMFTREEGLTGIENVEMVAMDIQNERELKMTLHNHHSLDPASIVNNFINRLKRHVMLLQSMFVSLLNLRHGAHTANKSVSPDKFGLRKVIVASTRHNKIYGLDSMSGNVLWQVMFPGYFDKNSKSPRPQSFLRIQKDGVTGDFAEATFVYRHARSLHFMMIFDPLTGKIKENRAIPLQLDQVLLLPESPDHELKPLLLVGKDGRAILHPANAINCIRDGPPVYVATTPKGTIVGNRLSVKGNGDLTLVPIWSLLIQPTSIISVSTTHPEEKIHSAGRVLADRSVLFKYMNPNLALIMTKGDLDNQGKLYINVYLVDLVTGRLFYTATHKKVLPPFFAVHSENWAVYTYFNEKARRTELVSLELYEGKSQSNSSTFSSIENTVTPLVERQAYILTGSDITAVRDTITGKGITSKHLLIGYSNGAIQDLPLHMVDPRRPALTTPPHMREPGLMPYIPELKIPSENTINYNQTLLGVQSIVTSPSGLESTTLVFVHGLDLYGTRLTPSKGFDLLKDDFDYVMISTVMFGLVAASYVTRKLSQKKMLSLAWK